MNWTLTPEQRYEPHTVPYLACLLNTTEEKAANSKHFVGGGTGLTGWVGAAVPTGEMRC
jgi:hypothetical protein